MYRVVTYTDALDQIAALPISALRAYADTFGALELAPWAGRPYNDDKPEGPMRQMTFGSGGLGSVTYLVLDDQREVHVLVVQWIGPD